MTTMEKGLIGYTGFVGTTLLKQTHFDACFRSTNIGEIANQSFDMLVCSGAPAQKWIANQNPEADLANINRLIDALKQVKTNKIILISTVDVFKSPVAVDESSPIDINGLHAYGLNRYYLEQFITDHFEFSLIVRLPGLVGPGLRKNIIFDLLNNNLQNNIDSRHVFQFYPLVNLWYDIQIALENNLSLIHLTAQPIAIADVAKQGFGLDFVNQNLAQQVIRYDMRSQYAALFSGDHTKPYQYSQKETVGAIRAYAQSEPKTLKSE